MIIIFEGPDCSGKSTLVEMVKENLERYHDPNCRFYFPKVQIIKESATQNEKYKRNRVQRMWDLIGSKNLYLYDRATIIDDFVYRPIVEHKESELDVEEVRKLLRYVTVMHVDTQLNTLTTRLDERGDEYIDKDMLQEICAKYQEVYELLQVTPYYINGEASLVQNFQQVYEQLGNRPKQGLAHIVNLGSLDLTQERNYHMSLAHLVLQNKEYCEFYQTLSSDPEKFVILDNGAAENSQLELDDLLECYRRIRPSEIVLPDSLMNKDETISKMKESLKVIFHDERLHDEFDFQVMGVPQGSTFDEWKECVDVMLQEEAIDTLGVSKFITAFGYDIRLEACKYIQQKKIEYKRHDVVVHLLGCNEHPLLIKQIMRQFSFVRGCDSAYAYLCNQAGEEIYRNTTRPKGEIEFLKTTVQDGIEKSMTDMDLACGIDW